MKARLPDKSDTIVSTVMAAYDPEQQVTTFFVLAGQWSDGTPGPPMSH